MEMTVLEGCGMTWLYRACPKQCKTKGWKVGASSVKQHINEVLSNLFHLLSISQLQRRLRHFAARLRCCPAGYSGGIYGVYPLKLAFS